jgi:hypothetical protein
MDRDREDQRRASMRVSDADREQFVEALRQHHADGRITLEELTERTEKAHAARTFGDLDALGTDLPPVPRSPAAAPPSSADPPPRTQPPGPRQTTAARTNLLRSAMWYGALSVFLVVIWALSGGGYFWPVWPIVGFALLVGWQVIGAWSQLGRSDDDRPGPGR